LITPSLCWASADKIVEINICDAHLYQDGVLQCEMIIFDKDTNVGSLESFLFVLLFLIDETTTSPTFFEAPLGY
jgi:hypothetical protein